MVQEKFSAIRTLQISLLSLSCLIAYVRVGIAQPSNVVSSLQDMIPGKYAYFTTDKLKRIYAVNAANELIQFDSNGKELFRYNNNTLGELTYIDTSNPFNLLLFYPEFQTIITLDRTLNPIAELNLLTTEVGDPTAVALSNDNQLWIYDAASLQLKKLNAKGEVLLSSGDLSLGLPSPPEPEQIVASADRVYLNDPAKGLIIFNNFGQYLQMVPIRGITYFQVLEQQLIYRVKSGKLFSYNLQSLLTSPIDLANQTAKSRCVNIQSGLLYSMHSDGIRIELLK
ncbi:MAG: hypothetical protein KTR30_16025 [Saprospiraceae bacterium]|nr:hypothetical protein [Saprospiraceae bacterium]